MAKEAIRKQDLERSTSVMSSTPKLFREAANAFPGLTHVLSNYPASDNRPKLPECYDYDNVSPFWHTNTWKVVAGKKVRDHMIIHWLCQPEGHSWSLETAQWHLRNIAQLVPNVMNEKRWMLKLHSVLKPEKYVLATLEDIQQGDTLSVGCQPCRQAQPGEAFFSVIEDVFLHSAAACEEFIVKTVQANTGTLDPDKGKTGKTRGRKPLTKKEVEKRLRILQSWLRASEAGISRKQFCDEEDIDIIDDLERYQAWERQRNYRK